MDNRAITIEARVAPSRILLLGVWFGLLTGIGEISTILAQQYVLGKIILIQLSMSEDFFWMSALANAFLFSSVGLFLSMCARYWPKLVTARGVVFCFVFLSFFCVLKNVGGLHFFAALLLAAGLAAQLARFIVNHAYGFQTLVAPSTAWIVVLLIGWAVVSHGRQQLSERAALAKLAPAPPKSPNVLLIVLDTVRAQNLSLYGYVRPTTPNLERLAKLGVLFERAVSTAPWTLPSHASMFTGLFPYEVSADWEAPLDTRHPTLAEAFRSNGYLTAGFVANIYYCNSQFGLDRGFIHYEDQPISLGMVIKSSWLARNIAWTFLPLIGHHQDLDRKTGEDINRHFLEWLSRSDGRPFFAFLNYYDAHSPYLPPKPFNLKFASKGSFYRLQEYGYKYSSKEIQDLVDNYDSSISYLDHQLGVLFDTLEKRGILKNTLVIITADHGEEFQEHGIVGHGNSLYIRSLHVPLLIIFPPGAPAGTRVADPISLRNLPATVMDLVKLDVPKHFPGTSFAEYWNGRRASDELGPVFSEVSKGIGTPLAYPVSRGDMKSVVIDRLHYIKNGDGQEEIYHLVGKRAEKVNFAALDGFKVKLERFRTTLERISSHSTAAK